MRAIKLLFIAFMLLLMDSCIDPFYPGLTESQDLLVVNGMITDLPGEHLVEIIRSSALNDPAFIPVEGCVVEVVDEQGTGVLYHEQEPGTYRAELGSEFLGINKAYRLQIFTPDGDEYQSDYDSLLACPPVENLYYETEFRETSNPYVSYYGLQFYADVSGDVKEAANFLWQLEETFEYHSPYVIHHIWDGYNKSLFEPIDSLYVCYKTQTILEIHTASTRNLSENKLVKFPLAYVSSEGNRFRFRYSLLAKQHSLSDGAFQYWDRLKNQHSGQGGLYETQPHSSEGNLCNVNKPEEIVLGFFFATQVKEKRIIINRSFNFPFHTANPCILDTAEWSGVLPEKYLYLISLSEKEGFGPPYGYTSNECFNCELNGGTIEVPEFWDNEE